MVEHFHGKEGVSSSSLERGSILFCAMKKLYRSRTDRKVAGVCGGLATYTNTDVTLWRVAAVILALPGGPSILIYFLLWLIMPEAPHKSDKVLDKA